MSDGLGGGEPAAGRPHYARAPRRDKPQKQESDRAEVGGLARSIDLRGRTEEDFVDVDVLGLAQREDERAGEGVG